MRCSLRVVRCVLSFVDLLFIVWYWSLVLFVVVFCLMIVDCSLSFVVCCLLLVVCCLVFLARCLLISLH